MPESMAQSTRVARYLTTVAGGTLILSSPAFADITVHEGPHSVMDQGGGTGQADMLWVDILSGATTTDIGVINSSDSSWFRLNHYYWTTTSTRSIQFGIGGNTPVGQALEFIHTGNFRSALRLSSGEIVDSTRMFGRAERYNLISTSSSGVNVGNDNGWLGGGNGYLGFRFEDEGTTLYGWAEITVGSTSEGFTLERWAFDDSGDAIAVGQVPTPGTLGIAALALGAAGIRSSRKE